MTANPCEKSLDAWGRFFRNGAVVVIKLRYGSSGQVFRYG
jgi:hypothetical protein